jgi:hypothetical protein
VIATTPPHVVVRRRGFEFWAGLRADGAAPGHRFCIGVLVIGSNFRLDDLGGGR